MQARESYRYGVTPVDSVRMIPVSASITRTAPLLASEK